MMYYTFNSVISEAVSFSTFLEVSSNVEVKPEESQDYFLHVSTAVPGLEIKFFCLEM